MKHVNKGFYYICLLFFCLTCFNSNPLYAAKGEGDTWSFDFKNCTISDAFSQITKVTGIKVLTNKTIDNKISNKSYKNKAVDRILMEMLGNENYAMVWYYDGEKLDSIGIWVFDQAGDMAGFSPNKFLDEKGANSKNKTIHMKKYIQGQEDSNSYLPDPKETIVTQYDKTSAGGKSYYGGHNVSNKQRASSSSQSASNNKVGENQNGSDIQNQEASERGINDDVTQQQAVADLPSIPVKWGHLEPPPMPPGF